MAPPGCLAAVILAAVVATSSAAPQPPLPLRPADHVFPVERHPADSDLPLVQQATAKGLILPPRNPLERMPAAAGAANDSATGAQMFPFGLANPLAPHRSRESRPYDVAAAARTKREADDIYDETRLPTIVVPTRYTVVIAPQLTRGTYLANTDIYVNVLEATKRIVLHAAPDLSIREVQILKYDATTSQYIINGVPTILPLDPNEDLERLVIDLDTELVPGEHYLIRFPVFAAYLRTDLKGFYLSTYRDENGIKRVLGTTQFEPPAARYAFPCFDEPAFKARFKIIIEHDENLVAKSNMPEVKQTRPSLGIVRTEYDDTVPMSTYLLAWVVSDFGSVEDAAKTFKTWGRKNLISPRTAALSQLVGPKALEELNQFTGIPYALPKVDQFAIPDFEAGAMENWGLVTYREEYLLETSETTIRYREFIATTVCHELGHQWTGNLVTLDWWSNTWLNEGFATYFENVICDKIFADWKLMDKYLTDNVHVAIANDVVPGQVAMSSPVHGSGAIAAKFDRISYKKGGSVLRMFEHVLGTETFKKAMKRYLSANAFKSGTPERLFRAMDAEAQLAGSPLPEGVPFTTLAPTWTEQAGVPVVTVTRNYDTSTITLTQEQFFYARPDGHVDNLWFIPIPAVVDPTKRWDSTAPARWLTPTAPTIANLDVDAAKSQWIVVNPNQIGYYLVNYDETNWGLLRSALQATPADFPASTVTQLVHDALALARAGRLPYGVALPFLQALKDQREAAPWRAGLQAIAFLRDRLVVTEASEALKVFIQQITADAFDEVGFSSTPPSEVTDTSQDERRYLRFYLASYACSAGNPKCTAAAVAALNTLLNDAEPLDADITATAMCFGVQNSNDHLNKILKRYNEEVDAEQIGLYVAALSCTSRQIVLETLMDEILDSRTSKTPADLQQLINAILSRWENHKFMLGYYKKNWQKIAQVTRGNFYFNVLSALIADIRTQEEYTEVETFVRSAFVESSAARREAELHLAAAKTELEWSSRHFNTVAQWLYDVTKTGPVKPSTTAKPPNPTAPTTRPPPSTTPPSSASQAVGALSLLLPILLAHLLR